MNMTTCYDIIIIAAACFLIIFLIIVAGAERLESEM
jgi:hypothetical protein